MTGANFAAPKNPGTTLNIPKAATGAQIGALTRQFNSENNLHLEYDCIDQVLKHLLLGTVVKDYIDSLRDMYTGYTAVTPFELITHIMPIVKFRTWIWTKMNDA